MSNFYQIRMRAGGRDLARDIWESGHIGIWFGGWLPNEYELFRDLSAREQLQVLSRINNERGLNWPITPSNLGVIRRFYSLGDKDWICTCFGGHIHLGRVTGPVERGNQGFDRGGEIFKWRAIQNAKSFRLSDLPAPYRLVPAGALGTLFRLHAYKPMMQVLEESNNEKDVYARVEQLGWDKWLDFLGTKGVGIAVPRFPHRGVWIRSDRARDRRHARALRHCGRQSRDRKKDLRSMQEKPQPAA